MTIQVIVRSSQRRVVTVTPPPAPPTVTINRVALTAHIDDLQDIDVTDIPQPYPEDLDFEADERYSLVFDPVRKEWVAARETVITEIDGGEY